MEKKKASIKTAVHGQQHQIAGGIKEGIVRGTVFMPNDLVEGGSR